MSATALEKRPVDDAVPPQPRMALPWAVAWLTLGTAMASLGRWFCLIVLVKLGTDQVVGGFSLALMIATNVTVLGRFALRFIVATDASDDFRFQDYIGLQIITAPLCVLILVVIAGVRVFYFRSSADVAAAIVTMGVAHLIEATAAVLYGMMQKHERMFEVGLSMNLKGFGLVLSTYAAYVLTDSLAAVGVAMTVLWLAVVLCYDVPIVRRLLKHEPDGGRWLPWRRWGAIKRLGITCTPVALAAALRTFNANLPRYLLEWFWEARDTGYFSALLAPVNIGQFAIRSVGHAVGPRLARHHRKDVSSFLRLLGKLLLAALAAGVLGAMVALAVGPQLLSIVYTPDYARFNNIFVWLIAAAGVMLVTSIVRAGLISARYLASQVPIIVLTTTLLFGAGCLLIPHYRLMGAAVATLIGMGVELLFSGGVLLYGLRGEVRHRPAAPAGAQPGNTTVSDSTS